MRKTADEWKDVVQNYEQSGLSQAEFCRRHQICFPTFYYWKKKFTAQQAQIVDAQFVEVPQKQVKEFFPSKTTQLSEKIGIIVHIRSMQIEIKPDFCPQTLKKILCILDEQC